MKRRLEEPFHVYTLDSSLENRIRYHVVENPFYLSSNGSSLTVCDSPGKDSLSELVIPILLGVSNLLFSGTRRSSVQPQNTVGLLGITPYHLFQQK